MTTVTTAHTATGNGTLLFVANKQSYTHVITGTFVATWIVETTKDQINFKQIATGTGTSSSTIVIVDENDTSPVFVRSRISAFTSGTCTVVLADVADAIEGDFKLPLVDAEGVTLLSATDGGMSMGGTLAVTGAITLSNISSAVRTAQKKVITSGAKVGGTAGIVVDAANDKNSLLTCPQSKTANTAVVKIPDLKIGDTITAFSVVGQIESGGNTVTIDADLRAQTAVAAGNTDASVGAITQVSKTADYLVNDSKTGLSHTVIDGNSYYVLVTITTGATCDVDLLAITVSVTES